MKITVVGDTLLDEDIDGVSTRQCPDAPVPVIEVTRRVRRAGGAGLVATMLARDGHDVELVTALSTDDASDRLRTCLSDVILIEGRSGAGTPVKSRLRSNGQPLGRIDESCRDAPLPKVNAEMLRAVARAETIVVADYGRGLTGDPLLRNVLADRACSVPVVWDPHPRGSDPVPTVALVTPNLAEACELAGLPVEPASAERAGALLRERYGCDAVVVTLGDGGATLIESGRPPQFAPATPVTTSDPCGAGDRFASAVAVSLSAGRSRLEAVRDGVQAASGYLANGGVASLEGASPHRTRPTEWNDQGDRICSSPVNAPSVECSSPADHPVWGEPLPVPSPTQAVPQR